MTNCKTSALIPNYYIVEAKDVNATYKGLFNKTSLEYVCNVQKYHPTTQKENIINITEPIKPPVKETPIPKPIEKEPVFPVPD